MAGPIGFVESVDSTYTQVAYLGAGGKDSKVDIDNPDNTLNSVILAAANNANSKPLQTVSAAPSEEYAAMAQAALAIDNKVIDVPKGELPQAQQTPRVPPKSGPRMP